jgi:hypothetical protein
MVPLQVLQERESVGQLSTSLKCTVANKGDKGYYSICYSPLGLCLTSISEASTIGNAVQKVLRTVRSALARVTAEVEPLPRNSSETSIASGVVQYRLQTFGKTKLLQGRRPQFKENV